MEKKRMSDNRPALDVSLLRDLQGKVTRGEPALIGSALGDAANEIEQLRAQVAEMRKRHSEDIRDLQREMRDAVIEERWAAQQGGDYGSY